MEHRDQADPGAVGCGWAVGELLHQSDEPCAEFLDLVVGEPKPEAGVGDETLGSGGERRRTMLQVNLGRTVLIGLLAAVVLAHSEGLWMLAGLVLVSLTGTFRAVRHGAATTVFADVREGVDYLARHRLLRVFAACVGISNLASTAMIAILPLYLIRPGPGGFTEAGYGLLLTTLAVGSVFGTVAVERLRRFLGVRRTLCWRRSASRCSAWSQRSQRPARSWPSAS